MITTDGGLYAGTLESYDHTVNICLKNTVKRSIAQSEDESNREEKIGLFVLRGDSIAVIGLVEPIIDAQYDWSEVRGDKLKRYR